MRHTEMIFRYLFPSPHQARPMPSYHLRHGVVVVHERHARKLISRSASTEAGLKRACGAFLDAYARGDTLVVLPAASQDRYYGAADAIMRYLDGLIPAGSVWPGLQVP